ncbi:MAG: hypothetical protein C0490_16560 [Marivirga sp.]|nr:hypothetical protein [Marivirga sp.]
MKSINWLALTRQGTVRVIFSVVMIVFWSACSDDSADLSGPGADASAKSTSNAGDYTIVAVKDGATWTYTITKLAGAKGVSHFILDLNNCEHNQTLAFSSILSATVNGQPADLSDSEGNTGCDITTNNFVKFDNLPDASVYTIVFTLDKVYGNALLTTGWIKAGTSCHSYVINGPCCS